MYALRRLLAFGFAGVRISKKEGGSPVRVMYSTVCDTKLKLSDPMKAAPSPSRLLSNKTVGTFSQNFSIAERSDALPKGASSTPAGFNDRKLSRISFSSLCSPCELKSEGR
jgi:hypothetical protein